jgi:hypothetical protein
MWMDLLLILLPTLIFAVARNPRPARARIRQR